MAVDYDDLRVGPPKVGKTLDPIIKLHVARNQPDKADVYRAMLPKSE